jgi:hypothetical protein
MIYNVPALEIHVTHTCNLHCESCSHYSNHQLQGTVPLNTLASWIDAWKDRIQPQRFAILGGEPTLHPELPNILELVGTRFPKSNLELVTNGFFLEHHPKLPKMLCKYGVMLSISVHHNGPEYASKVAEIKKLLEKWQMIYPFRVSWRYSFGSWTRRYQGFGETLLPFHSNPVAGWSACITKNCPQLFNSKIWKCAPIAYLSLVKEKYRINEREWKEFLDYQPLSPDCTDQELNEFFQRGPESACSLCPAVLMHLPLPNPIA